MQEIFRNPEALAKSLLNKNITKVLKSTYFYNDIPEDIIGVCFLIDETNVMHFKCGQDGESLIVSNELPKEYSMEQNGFFRNENLSDEWACSIVKCKLYFSENKLFSMDLSFKNSRFLSITNWGDELILKEEPYATQEYLRSDRGMISVLEVS
jgi:hypothetical protein